MRANLNHRLSAAGLIAIGLAGGCSVVPMTIGVYDDETGAPIPDAAVWIESSGVNVPLGSCGGELGGGYQRECTGPDGIAHLTWPVTDRSTLDIWGEDWRITRPWPQALADGDPKRFEKLNLRRPPQLPDRLPDLVFLRWRKQDAQTQEQSRARQEAGEAPYQEQRGQPSQ